MKAYYLQMESPDDLVSVHRVGLALRIIDPPDGRVNQRLYREILSFGLLEAFIGQGFGSAALTLTVQYAWTLGAVHHVWLHTCDKDHPNARNTYQRRGFVHSDTKDNRVGQSKILP
jgi:GNAT superfamily N-acetyltransferase